MLFKCNGVGLLWEQTKTSQWHYILMVKMVPFFAKMSPNLFLLKLHYFHKNGTYIFINELNV